MTKEQIDAILEAIEGERSWPLTRAEEVKIRNFLINLFGDIEGDY